MSINQDILNIILDGLKEIQNQSYPICDHTENDVSLRAVNINKKARDLQITLEYFYKTNMAGDGR